MILRCFPISFLMYSCSTCVVLRLIVAHRIAVGALWHMADACALCRDGVFVCVRRYIGAAAAAAHWYIGTHACARRTDGRR